MPTSVPKIKKRYWGAVLYPESLPDDWENFLQELSIPIAISPLHDKDTNEDGSPKKPHYHAIFCYSSPTTYNNVKKSICDPLGQPAPIPLQDISGAYDYLIHKYAPDKYQYDAEKITTFSGFDISDYRQKKRSEYRLDRWQIILLIEENDIREFCELILLLHERELDECFDDVVGNAFFYDKYITSRRNKLKNI